MIEWSNGDYVMVNETIVLNFHHPEKMGLAYFLMSVIGLPVAVFQVLAYIVMFLTASRYGRVQTNQPQRSRMFATQLKLAITAFITSLVLMFVMVFTTLASAGGQYFNIYYFIYKIVIDIFYQCNPYVLLTCSSPLRRALFNLLRCSTKQPNFTVTPSQPNIATHIRSVRNSVLSARF
uniref:G-protein coupled receptors family 1 profile domain-containing protein n=1 Tax=Plectus sambesii TaxID=2011161 RepID=A0A914VB52_9BILA